MNIEHTQHLQGLKPEYFRDNKLDVNFYLSDIRERLARALRKARQRFDGAIPPRIQSKADVLSDGVQGYTGSLVDTDGSEEEKHMLMEDYETLLQQIEELCEHATLADFTPVWKEAQQKHEREFIKAEWKRCSGDKISEVLASLETPLSADQSSEEWLRQMGMAAGRLQAFGHFGNGEPRIFMQDDRPVTLEEHLPEVIRNEVIDIRKAADHIYSMIDEEALKLDKKINQLWRDNRAGTLSDTDYATLRKSAEDEAVADCQSLFAELTKNVQAVKPVFERIRRVIEQGQ